MAEAGSRRWRRWLLVPAALILLPASVLLGVDLWSRAEARAARRAWEAAPKGFAEIREDLRWREANASAVALEELAAPLGLNLVPELSERRRKPRSDFEAVELADAHVRSVLADGPQVTDPAPARLRSWLESHEEVIERVVEHLLVAQPPRWERDASPRPGRPGLSARNEGDLANLHAILLAEALARSESGRRAAAWRALEASWRLLQDWLERPAVRPRRAAAQVLWRHARLLRRWPAPPPEWSDELLGLDAIALWREALAHEAWWGLEASRSEDPLARLGNESSIPAGWKRELAELLVRPYLRLSTARRAERLHEIAAEVERSGPCRLGEAGLEPAGEPGADLAAFGVAELMRGIEATWLPLAIELELSRRVAELRRWRAAGSRGTPPASSAPPCPDVAWRLELREDGGFSLTSVGQRRAPEHVE